MRINLLDQKVKEVAHLSLTVAEEARVVFPELDVVLRYLPCHAVVFEAERPNLKLLFVVDWALVDVLQRIFGYAPHKNTTPVT